MKIESNKVVQVNYTLTDPEGKEIDSSVGREPLQYVHGNGYLITGLERELEGTQEPTIHELNMKEPARRHTATFKLIFLIIKIFKGLKSILSPFRAV